MSEFLPESISEGFGIDGVNIEQTLSQSFDPYSGLDINPSLFENTQQGLINADDDGRISLGMFFFDDLNYFSDNFPSVLGGNLKQVQKVNLVKNGNCRFVEKIYAPVQFIDSTAAEQAGYPGMQLPEPLENADFRAIEPQGNWNYINLPDVTGDNPSSYSSLFSNLFSQMDGPTDGNNFQGYGGYYSYSPLSSKLNIRMSYNYQFGLDSYTYQSLNIRLSQNDGEKYFPYSTVNHYWWGNSNGEGITINDYSNETQYNLQPNNQLLIGYNPSFTQDDVIDYLEGNTDTLIDLTNDIPTNFYSYDGAPPYRLPFGKTVNLDGTVDGGIIPYPPIATWINSSEAYSNNNCLCFVNWESWNENFFQRIFANTADIPENGGFGNVQYLNTLFEGEPFFDAGLSIDYSTSRFANQYRTLNQITKIYDKLNDDFLRPYSSLKIKLKMKTTHCVPKNDDGGNHNMPEIEIGVLSKDWNETPNTGPHNILDNKLNDNSENAQKKNKFIPFGNFNSAKYFDKPVLIPVAFDGMHRIKNSGSPTTKGDLNKWETFEFTFNLTDIHNNKGTIYGVPYGGMFDDERNKGPIDIRLNEKFDGSTEYGSIHFAGNYESEEFNPNYEPGTFGIPNSPAGITYSQDNGIYRRSIINLIHPNGTKVVATNVIADASQQPDDANNFRNCAFSSIGNDTFTIVRPPRNKLGVEFYLMYVPESLFRQYNNKDYGINPNTPLPNVNMKRGPGPMRSHIGFGGYLENQYNENVSLGPNLIVAYWDGGSWHIDRGSGYNYTSNNVEYQPDYTDNGYSVVASGDGGANQGSVDEAFGSTGNQSTLFYPTEDCFILGRLYDDYPINYNEISSLSNDRKGIKGADFYINNITGDNFQNEIENLYLFIQAGNDFHGRVLIDDIEVIESGDFYPDVDVRKKITEGSYGTADLTKYYDPIIHGENGTNQYKDTTAPLEANFYFYPSYPTDNIFDVERTPIYQDFKKGLFYIQDIDWGDGTAKEFISEPKQIDEETSIRHTYERSGVFEITGNMIRLKQEGDGVAGILHTKRFSLRISINQGDDEDFLYFGSDGFSFIPYKNTTPVIGGITKQSAYYKYIKRQLGFINVDESSSIEKTNITFTNQGDKLNTEIALDKMDGSFVGLYDLLDSYKIPRYKNGVLIYNGIGNKTEELGKSLGDVDIEIFKYYNKAQDLYEILGFNAASDFTYTYASWDGLIGNNIFNPPNEVGEYSVVGYDENLDENLFDLLPDNFDNFNLLLTTHDIPTLDMTYFPKLNNGFVDAFLEMEVVITNEFIYPNYIEITDNPYSVDIVSGDRAQFQIGIMDEFGDDFLWMGGVFENISNHLQIEVGTVEASPQQWAEQSADGSSPPKYIRLGSGVISSMNIQTPLNPTGVDVPGNGRKYKMELLRSDLSGEYGGSYCIFQINELYLPETFVGSDTNPYKFEITMMEVNLSSESPDFGLPEQHAPVRLSTLPINPDSKRGFRKTIPTNSVNNGDGWQVGTNYIKMYIGDSTDPITGDYGYLTYKDISGNIVSNYNGPYGFNRIKIMRTFDCEYDTTAVNIDNETIPWEGQAIANLIWSFTNPPDLELGGNLSHMGSITTFTNTNVITNVVSDSGGPTWESSNKIGFGSHIENLYGFEYNTTTKYKLQTEQGSYLIFNLNSTNEIDGPDHFIKYFSINVRDSFIVEGQTELTAHDSIDFSIVEISYGNNVGSCSGSPEDTIKFNYIGIVPSDVPLSYLELLDNNQLASSVDIGEHPGSPSSPRYWKNIIPKDYSIFNRDGINMPKEVTSTPNILINQSGSPDFEINPSLDLSLFPKTPGGFMNIGIGSDGSNKINAYCEFTITLSSLDYYPSLIRLMDATISPSLSGLVLLFLPPEGQPNFWLNFGLAVSDEGATDPYVWFGENNINEGEGWKVGENKIKIYLARALYAGGGGAIVYDYYPVGDENEGFLVQDMYNGGYNFTKIQVTADGAHTTLDEITETISINNFRIYSELQNIDVNSEQEWVDSDLDGEPDYYYPVLTKYGANGLLKPIQTDNNGNILPNTFPNNKIQFPQQGPITNVFEKDESLKIQITSEKDDNKLIDKAGFSNFGFHISDYKPDFDSRTLKPKIKRKFDKVKTKKTNGAF